MAEINVKILVWEEEMISDYEKAVGMTYSEAREYLKSIGRWDDVSDQDGFSIVQYAIEDLARTLVASAMS